MISDSIQQFLKLKLNEIKCSRNQLADKCDISYSLMNKLLHANQPKPSILTILKIANAFEKTIDSVINRQINKKKIH